MPGVNHRGQNNNNFLNKNMLNTPELNGTELDVQTSFVKKCAVIKEDIFLRADDEKDVLSKELLVRLSNKLLLATKVSGIGIWEYLIHEEKFIADDVLLSQYGITPEDFTGSFELWMQYIHPEDRESVTGKFREGSMKFSN